MSIKADYMYNAGFDHGWDAAVKCCFGGSNMVSPYFATSEEEDNYNEGYQDGYNSVDN